MSYIRANTNVDALQLTNFDGSVTLDISSAYGSFEIKESIFCTGLVGRITIVDTLELLQRLPIIGEETLRIKYRTAENVDPIDLTFDVYNISDIDSNETGHTKSYTLEFGSPEFVDSIGRDLSQSFFGSPDQIAVQIFKNLGSSKSFVADPSVGKMKFVVPRLTHLDAISWLAAIARETDPGVFTFFETTKGFKFRSVNQMIKANPVRSFIKGYSAADPGSADAANIIDDFKWVRQKDNLKSLAQNLFSGKVISVDPLSKTVNTKEYSYANAGFKNIDGSKVKLTSGSSKYDNAAGRYISTMSLSDSKDNAYIKDKGVADDLYGFSMEEILIERQAKIQQLNNLVAVVSVPGDTSLQAGDVVELNLPSETSDPDDSRRITKQKYVAGRYLVLSLTHRVDARGNYLSYLECARDSLADVPEAA